MGMANCEEERKGTGVEEEGDGGGRC